MASRGPILCSARNTLQLTYPARMDEIPVERFGDRPRDDPRDDQSILVESCIVSIVSYYTYYWNLLDLLQSNWLYYTLPSGYVKIAIENGDDHDSG